MKAATWVGFRCMNTFLELFLNHLYTARLFHLHEVRSWTRRPGLIRARTFGLNHVKKTEREDL